MTLRELWKTIRPRTRAFIKERHGGRAKLVFVDPVYLPENEEIMKLMDREIVDVALKDGGLRLTVEEDEPPSTIEELIRDEGEETK